MELAPPYRHVQEIYCTIYGDLPGNYAFLHDGSCKFSTEFAANKNEFSIVLNEWRNEQKYNHCFARGIFRDIERLATVIDLWAGKQKGTIEIKRQFEELELFEDFEVRSLHPDIDLAWTKVKNMFFNDLTFWKSPEWNSRYYKMTRI